MPTPAIIATLRTLQLPYRHDAEHACADALAEKLLSQQVSDSDAAAWVSLEINAWQEQGTPSRQLLRVTRAVFEAAAEAEDDATMRAYQQFASSYFDVHKKIIEEHGLTYPEATAALSHATLIISLAVVDRLSSAQVARVVEPKDKRARFSRQLVGDVLLAARIAPTLGQADVEGIYQSDSVSELGFFGDASILVAAEEVGNAAAQFGLEDSFKTALMALSPLESEEGVDSRWTPYLQILHYQCTIAEYFDHAILDLYEFSPRGATAGWLFEKYPHSIAGAANPFLNNAKSVEVVDEGWVRSKKRSERKGARAIYQLLSSLDALGFSARREIAKTIRLWLHRIIRVASEQPLPLPGHLTPQQIRQLLASAGAGNTRSFGIIEQRLLDAAATMIHPAWRSRGVRDSVNATNVSSGKFGDCEFIDARSLEIHAYEAHGGSLSNIYVKQHLLSLRKSISGRLNELSAVADPAQWQVIVHFVAHDISQVDPVRENIFGLQVKVVPKTFAALFEDLVNSDEAGLVGVFQDLVVTPMRETRTPNAARHRLLELAGA